jgi:hypothetical protein
MRKVMWVILVGACVCLLWLALARREEPAPSETGKPKAAEVSVKESPAGEPRAPSVSVAKDSRPQSPAPGPAASPAVRPAPAPVDLPAGASTVIRLIAGQTAEKDYVVRSTAVHALSKDLSRADVEGLYAFLRSHADGHRDLDLLSLDALKNDVLQALIGQEALPPDLLTAMAAMYRDATLDVMWRDYCLQHVAQYYERRWQPQDASRLEDPDRKEAMRIYEEALASRGEGLEGTGMIGLERLSERYSEIDRARLSKEALEAAQDERRDLATRVTAMGICGLMGKAEVLPTARILAQTGENTTLRLAAIGTIGLIGTEEDLELMQSLEAGGDEASRKAAKAAVKRLQGRLPKAS